MSDNFRFDMTGVDLGLALQVAFSQHRSAMGWQVEAVLRDEKQAIPGGEWGANQAKERLVLYWAKDNGATPFMSPLGRDEIRPMIESWLKEADYGAEPDHDGDNEKGCRVYNESWGHVGGQWAAFVAIEPVWLLYGK